MAIDPRRLRPGEACRLLNSTPLGEVTNERRLFRDRTAAGVRIGEGHVDLLAYTAWLAAQRHLHGDEDGPEVDPYEQVKERARARAAALSLAGRDIGELPAVVDQARKDKAATDFQFFCDTYFPLTFYLPWSPDHIKVIRKIERSVLHGGLFAMAMPRGSGKTTICECACLWAALNGHRDFVMLIGPDEGLAADMLDSIKTELEGNDLLFADFPEAVFPIRALQGLAGRCAGQLYKGERTHISWERKEVVLATIPGAKCSGAIMRVAGITGQIRGAKFKRPDGQTARPSLVLLDDPQTDESARSNLQCATREAVIAGAVLGLAGPGKKITGVMPCTVIRPGDLADNILDQQKHPEWNAERTKMMTKFPVNDALWARYGELRAESLIAYGDIRLATEFYAANMEAMNFGAEVSWPERFEHDELSGIQSAMNLKLRNEAAFFAEYQNEPLPERKEDIAELTADQIMAKVNRIPRYRLQLATDIVTAFVDVQPNMLWFAVCGWSKDFTGFVVDYGAWPDQQRSYYSKSDARNTLASATGASGLEGQIYGGLTTLVKQLAEREWEREDGAQVRTSRILIDANWGQSTDVVYQFCRQSQHAAIIYPSHGKYVGASSIPFAEYKKRPGDRVGNYWRIPNVAGKRTIRHVLMDVNYWKSFVHSRLRVSMGDHGCLSLFGDSPAQHRLIADHLRAEYREPVRNETTGRKVDEWKERPNRPDNDLFDCIVGCAVGASIEGAAMPDVFQSSSRSSRRVAVRPPEWAHL